MSVVGYGLERAMVSAARNGKAKAAAKPAPKKKLVTPTHKQVAVINAAVAQGSGRADLSQVSKRRMEGSLILDTLCNVLRYYARWADEHWITVTALWIAHTWFTDAEDNLLFRASPRYGLIGPTGVGKSRIGEMVADFAKDAEGPLSGVVTAPGVRDALANHKAVILDEFHKLVGMTGYRRLDLLAYVLAYTKRSGGSLNARSDSGKTSSFAPMAFLAQCMVEDFPIFEDILNRSFIVHPQRAKRGDKVPQLDERYYRLVTGLTKALGYWAAQEYQESIDPDTQIYWPVHTMPEVLENRNYELAQTLCAVGDRAVQTDLVADGGLDLRWALKAREACCSMLLGTGNQEREMTSLMDDAAELQGLLEAS